MRNAKEMHWFLWEAIRDEADAMDRYDILPLYLWEKVNAVGKGVVSAGAFTKELRTLACEVEEGMKPYEEELQVLLDKEQEEMNGA